VIHCEAQSTNEFLKEGGIIKNVFNCNSFGTTRAGIYEKCDNCIKGNKEKCFAKKEKLLKKIIMYKSSIL